MALPAGVGIRGWAQGAEPTLTPSHQATVTPAFYTSPQTNPLPRKVATTIRRGGRGDRWSG